MDGDARRRRARSRVARTESGRRRWTRGCATTSSATRCAAAARRSPGFAERFAARLDGRAHGARAASRAPTHPGCRSRGPSRPPWPPSSSSAGPPSHARCAAHGARQGARGHLVRAAQLSRSRVPPDYLLAHQEYSPTTPIQGVGPYLRAVSAGGVDVALSARHVDRLDACIARTASGSRRRAALRFRRRPSLAVARSARLPLARGRGRVAVARARGRGARRKTTSARSSTSMADTSRHRDSRTSRRTAASSKSWSASTARRASDPQHGEVRCYYPDANRPRRAAHVPQRVSVAVAQSSAALDRVLRFPQGGACARRGHRYAGLVFEPKRRLALWPQVLGGGHDRIAAQGALVGRARRDRRAVRVHGRSRSA